MSECIELMAIGYDKAIADVVVTAHRQPTVDAQPKWIPVTEREE